VSEIVMMEGGTPTAAAFGAGSVANGRRLRSGKSRESAGNSRITAQNQCWGAMQ